MIQSACAMASLSRWQLAARQRRHLDLEPLPLALLAGGSDAGGEPRIGVSSIDTTPSRPDTEPWINELSPQLTAFFTSAPIFFSSVAVSFFSAKEVGHMAPSSRFAASLKPNVAYLDLNFCALWK
jgi:hypothetical protein